MILHHKGCYHREIGSHNHVSQKILVTWQHIKLPQIKKKKLVLLLTQIPMHQKITVHAM